MRHEISIHRLQSGSELLIVNLPHANSIQFNTYVRSGYRFGDLDRYELPHLLEHLAFSGTRRYPNSLAFNELIDRTGSYANASTNINENCYEYACSPETIWEILPLAVSQLFEPLFAPKSIAQEKRVIEAELLEYRDDTERRIEYQVAGQMLPKLKPSWRSRIRGLELIKRSEIIRFHRLAYGTNNIKFVASGPFGKHRARKLRASLDRLLMGKRRGRALAVPATHIGKYRRVVKRLPIKGSQNHFNLSFSESGYDQSALVPLRLLSAMCDDGDTARIYQKVRQQGLAYGIQTNRWSTVDFTGFEISGEANPAKLLPLLRLVVGELSSLAQGKFSDQELERARGGVVGGLARIYETPMDYAEWYGEHLTEGHPLVSPEERRSEVSAVSRATVEETAQRYLNHDNWLLTVAGERLPAERSLRRIIDTHF